MGGEQRWCRRSHGHDRVGPECTAGWEVWGPTQPSPPLYFQFTAASCRHSHCPWRGGRSLGSGSSCRTRLLLSDTELGGVKDQRSLQAANKPCGVPAAGYIILRLLQTVPSSLMNGGWPLSTLGLFIVGPALGGKSWEHPWAAVKGLPWSLRAALGYAGSGEGSALVPETAQHCPTEWGL